jgi:hypothetical protein
LEQNQIDSLEKLKCLAGYKIRKINLEGNPVVENNKEYRKELFDLIPSLTSIDGIGKNGENVESTLYGGEEEDGEFEGEIDDDEEGEEIDDGGEDDEGDGEEDDEEDENKPNKKPKH